MLYVALLRGINVGGKNKVSMAGLKACLEDLGFNNVKTYIASGNVIFETKLQADKAAGKIENTLPKTFKLDSSLIKVLVLSRSQLKKIVDKAPGGFGQSPAKYHSDVAFLIGKSSTEAMEQVELRPGIDKAWPGDGVVYFQRLSAQLTKSRINKIASTTIYQFMTLRSWNTARKLNVLMQDSAT